MKFGLKKTELYPFFKLDSCFDPSISIELDESDLREYYRAKANFEVWQSRFVKAWVAGGGPKKEASIGAGPRQEETVADEVKNP